MLAADNVVGFIHKKNCQPDIVGMPVLVFLFLLVVLTFVVLGIVFFLVGFVFVLQVSFPFCSFFSCESSVVFFFLVSSSDEERQNTYSSTYTALTRATIRYTSLWQRRLYEFRRSLTPFPTPNIILS